MPFLLLPAVVLVAQAPANVDLAQRFNTELPVVNQMLKAFQAKEALVKMEGLVPAERPAFNGTNLQTIGQSMDNAQGLVSLYRLWANVASETGQWEKALEIQQKRSQLTQAIRADLAKAQAPIAAQWEKAALDSKEFMDKASTRQPELQASLKAIQEELAAVNAGTKKLDAKAKAEFQARLEKANKQDQPELDQITAALPVHKQNLANAPKVAKFLADFRKEADDMVKAADEATSKAKDALTAQNNEITEFNTKQIIKKVKVVGKKNWVDAVMHTPENITKLPTPQAQAAFLNRLLILDPGNVEATKVLDHLKAGKELFPKEVKGAKKPAPKKAKK
jgi:hypothetical protein